MDHCPKIIFLHKACIKRNKLLESKISKRLWADRNELYLGDFEEIK